MNKTETEPSKEKTKDYKWKPVRPSETGFYHFRGRTKNPRRHLDALLLVDVEKGRVFISSKKHPLSINQFTYGKWVGPFSDPEEYISFMEESNGIKRPGG